jgi:hypothetical protein
MANHTFKAGDKLDLIVTKAKNAMALAIVDLQASLQIRISKGQTITGGKYNYSESSLKKGKQNPVNWTDTGTLRRSIDNEIKISKDSINGFIGIKDIGRGKTSNSGILGFLIDKFPGIWGLSKTEIKQFKQNLLNYFKR